MIIIIISLCHNDHDKTFYSIYVGLEGFIADVFLIYFKLVTHKVEGSNSQTKKHRLNVTNLT